MSEDTRDRADRAASPGAQRVRDWRRRRRAAGLVEVKAWVRPQDAHRAWTALRPLTDAAGQDLDRRERQGRTNRVAVEVRFPGVPPAAFRERLRQGCGLEWDRAARCWRGALAGAAEVDELRRLVAPHAGAVEAGPGA